MKLPAIAVPALPDDPSAAALLSTGFAASINRLYTNIQHEGHESVHQARVATRHLRSNIQTFRPLLDGDKWLRKDLRHLAGLLGEVRDRDVFILGLTGEAAAIQALRRAWSRRRDTEWGNLVRYLKSDSFERLVFALTIWARTPPVTELARQSGPEVLTPLIKTRWQQLAAIARLPNPDPPTLHRIRILAKRVRYGAELVEPVAGKPAARFAAGAERLQDVLGEYRDATIAHGILLGVGRKLPSQHAVVLGELAGIQWARREAALGRWRVVFEALDRKKLRRWM